MEKENFCQAFINSIFEQKYIYRPMPIKQHLPNFLTLCNAACGLICIIATLEGWGYPIILMFFAAANLFDLFDGMLARALKMSSSLGGELDSLSDAISFVCFPALLVYQSLINAPYHLKWVALICIALGVLRLGRFNVKEDHVAGYFTGLPTPAFAIFVVAINYFLSIGNTGNVNIYMLAAVYVFLAFLLNSSYPFLNFKLKELKTKYLIPRLSLLLLPIIFLFYNDVLGVVIILILYRLISIIAFKKEFN